MIINVSILDFVLKCWIWTVCDVRKSFLGLLDLSSKQIHKGWENGCNHVLILQ